VGFGLLGLAAERVSGAPFAHLMELEVFKPLGITAYIARLPERRPIVIGDIPSPLVGTAAEPYNSDMSLVCGTPWANVISDVKGLLTLTRAYGEDGGLLSHELSIQAQTDQTEGVGGGFASNAAFLGHGPSRTIAWDNCAWGLSIELQGGKLPHWAPNNLPKSFGQIGSSGCLAWCDPESGTAWAIIGPRTTESGWLLRHGGRIAQTALTFAAEEPSSMSETVP
jgi:CubicO group peptidase (beta-lactamase class C family)